MPTQVKPRTSTATHPLGLRFEHVLAALFASAIYIFCIHRQLLADPDIWWHLKDAEYLFQHRSFIHRELFTYSVEGSKWMNPEWLSEAVYYLAWRLAGYRGLETTAILMIEALAGGVCLLAWQRTRNVRAALLAGCCFMLFATVSIGPRTQMFGWLCFLTELAVLHAFRQGRDRLWFLPPLFLLWINLHGSWPIGIVFFAVFALCGMRGFERGAIVARAWTPQQLRHMAIIGLLCLFALFVNPYGWRLVVYPLTITTQHALTLGAVQEWQSLDFHSFRGRAVFAMLAGLLFAGALRRRVWELYDVVTLIVASLAAFSYSRFLLLGGAVICPLLAREFVFDMRSVAKKEQPLLNAAIVALAGLFVATHLPSQRELKSQSDAGYPVDAVAWLRQHPQSGEMLNAFDWGGYLIWNQPSVPVYIDTRADVFEDSGILLQYVDTIALRTPIDGIGRGGVGYVLMPVGEPLVRVLRRSTDWTVVYEDRTAAVLIRKSR
ncbi:hypothetical protein SAMN05421770_1011126 [Granulicella rosea]|uniref:Dolichyl-phosphate-mannose-protein mannosyltransferase n=1 Tax=Granulicella rosea TaxID=474952 RepID=A0A239ERW7_9BACT|nr:hypothetical protein [Granulicella rosea]SNS47367.1 hypothetical protein SAMN05421770_1011126 [Granulicella rosea]